MDSTRPRKGKWRQKKFVLGDQITPKTSVYLRVVKLVEIVYQKHFSYLTQDKEDLISIGVIKAISMLERGDFDSTKGDMMNYLYSGIRNSIYNYYTKNIKFGKREVLSEDLSLVLTSLPLHDFVMDIDVNLVYKHFLELEKYFGNLRMWVSSEIENLGLFPKNIGICKEIPELSKVNTSRLQAYLVWKIFDEIIE